MKIPPDIQEFLKALVFGALVIIGALAVSQVRATEYDLAVTTAVMMVGPPALMDDGTYGQFSCSGTVIAPETVLTAKHCLEAAWRVRTADGVWHTVYGGKIDQVQDAAVIYVRGVACPCAPIGGELKVGDEVRAVGFPGGQWLDSAGFVLEILRFTNGVAAGEVLVGHSAFTFFGASGGGLWAVQDGRLVLVGVHSRIVFAGMRILSFAVPVTELRR